jgi:hypothetical protein
MTINTVKVAPVVPVVPDVQPAPVDATPSPNDGWKEDKRLDENGNPLEAGAPQVIEPEAKVEGDGEQTAELDETETPKTPTVAFDAAAATKVQPFLESAGLVPSEVALEVTAAGGEVSIEIMAKLVEKHGEGVAGLIKDQLSALHVSNVTSAKAADNKMFSQVEEAFKGVTEQSGADTFKELATWAKVNLTVAERTEFNGLLKQGGKAAELAIGSLVTSFKGSDAFVAQPAKLLTADNTASSPTSQPLDKAGYSRELRKLMDAGHNYETSPEIATLNARRTKSINRGY